MGLHHPCTTWLLCVWLLLWCWDCNFSPFSRLPSFDLAIDWIGFGGDVSYWCGGRTTPTGFAEAISPISCMSHRPSLPATLDSVISQLQALWVALDEEPSSEVPGTGSVTSFEWISPLEQEAPAESLPVSSNPSVGRAAPWTAAWDLALQLALTPGEFLAVDLSPLNPLIQSSRLLSAGEWTPPARLARALAAGRSARRALLEGHYSQDSTALLPEGLRNTFYLCLYCPSHPRGFWTGSAKVYFANIKGSGGERFHPQSVSHSFPSRAESAAFLLGAQAEWPPQLQ